MANIKVSIINASTVLSDIQVQAMVPALQTQVHRDFAPAWGIDADLTFVRRGGTPAPNSWWLSVLNNTDIANALGYHDRTNQGKPIAKVFAKTAIDHGRSVSVTASHELLEMLADPEINLTVFNQTTPIAGRLYAYEVCDPSPADSQGYVINGVRVSNFVFPAWFEPFNIGAQYDYRHLISSPLHFAPSGYIGVFDVTSGSGWHLIFSENIKEEDKEVPVIGTRRERRARGKDGWVNSVLVRT